MEPSSSTAPPSEPAILFRPSKKRKIYRQRATSPSSPSHDDKATTGPPAPISPSSPGAQTLDELISSSTTDSAGQELSVADILRQRKQHRPRVGGVEFRAAAPTRANDETALTVRDEGTEKDRDRDAAQEVAPAGGIIRQFSRQTGFVGDVDKHMVAYIDSELAKRQQPASTTTTSKSNLQLFSSPPEDPLATTGPPTLLLPNRQPAALGKLQEIDLGPSTRDQNVHRTLRALDPTPAPEPAPKPPRPRIGRDGKPYIPKARKRRDSDAMRRDALVDQVMSENRIEIYEALPGSGAGGNGGGSGGGGGNGNGEGSEQADEALEEAFRQEFLDAVASRQRLKKPVPVSGGGGKMGKMGKEEEGLKGPKLGGSRSARAAMRDRMLAEQKAGKR